MPLKKLFLIPLLLFAVATFPAGESVAATANSAELENAVRNLLSENPNLILDVLRQNSEAVLDIAQQGSNLRRKHNLEAQWREDLAKDKETRLKDRPVLGNKDAKVKIIAFSDFTCHFCEQASKTLDAIREEYGDDVALVFKHLPLDEKGPGALASAYFIAISQQSEPKAWEFYHKMFDNRERLLAEGEPFIKQTAESLGLDVKKLQKEAQSKKVKDILAQDLEDGQKLGIEGTPYFLVNNLVIRGALPLELFKNAVDMAKAAKS
ncbi:MAG: thioredoxin domain-containing protein [Desulfovibrio sp.]|nr:thioredoxin domain-containing protein [Desulfovibrio sp.]